MDSKTLFELALVDLQKGFTTRASTRLRQASISGHRDAQLELGKLLLRFGPRHPGFDEGLSWIARSADSELAPAHHAMSALEIIQGNFEKALVHLNLAADNEWAPSMIALAVFWAERGDTHNAAAWLKKAAGRSKIGLCLSRLLKEQPASAPPLEQWMRHQQRPSDWTVWDDRLPVRTMDQFCPTLEQAWLRLHAAKNLEKARVFNPITGRSEADPIRNNRAMHFGLPPLEPVVARLVSRISSALDAEAVTAEPLAILHYSQGERYLPHCDGLGNAALQRDPLSHAGNRLYTALVYLNSPLAGGATSFPKLDVEIPPTPGRLLVFDNLSQSRDGLNSLSLHTGTPVLQGVKWLASLWLRERNIFDASATG